MLYFFGRVQVELRVAAIGFFGVLLGALISVEGSWFVADIQEQRIENRHTQEKQANLISAMSDSLAYAGRINGLIQGHIIQIAASQQINQLCVNGAITGNQPKNCDQTELNKTTDSFNKEIFEKTASFQSARHLSNVYFCSETQSMLSKPPFSSEWWEATTKQTEELLKAMKREYGCKKI